MGSVIFTVDFFYFLICQMINSVQFVVIYEFMKGRKSIAVIVLHTAIKMSFKQTAEDQLAVNYSVVGVGCGLGGFFS